MQATLKTTTKGCILMMKRCWKFRSGLGNSKSNSTCKKAKFSIKKWMWHNNYKKIITSKGKGSLREEQVCINQLVTATNSNMTLSWIRPRRWSKARVTSNLRTDPRSTMLMTKRIILTSNLRTNPRSTMFMSFSKRIWISCFEKANQSNEERSTIRAAKLSCWTFW